MSHYWARRHWKALAWCWTRSSGGSFRCAWFSPDRLTRGAFQTLKRRRNRQIVLSAIVRSRSSKNPCKFAHRVVVRRLQDAAAMNRGFSLIEVLVATTLTTAATVGLAQLALMSARVNHAARD